MPLLGSDFSDVLERWPVFSECPALGHILTQDACVQACVDNTLKGLGDAFVGMLRALTCGLSQGLGA